MPKLYYRFRLRMQGICWQHGAMDSNRFAKWFCHRCKSDAIDKHLMKLSEWRKKAQG